MRITKWTKWQLAAVGAVGVAILFNQVKDSAEFAQAVDEHQSDRGQTGVAAQQTTDGVVREWQSSQRGSTNSAGNSPRGGSTGSQDNSSNPSSKNQQPSGNSGSKSTQPQTRTRHS